MEVFSMDAVRESMRTLLERRAGVTGVGTMDMWIFRALILTSQLVLLLYKNSPR